MSVEAAEVVEPRKLRLWWLWWTFGWVLIAATVNQSLQARVWQVADVLSWDKANHCVGYFLLTIWFTGVARRSRYLAVGALLIAFGGSMEIAQGLMHEGRTADWLDFFANSLGVATGVTLAMLGLGNWMIWVEKLFRVRKE